MKIATNRLTAEEAYAGAVIAARHQIQEIADRLEDVPAPGDETNWADVGSANEVLRRLTAVLAFLDGEEV